MSECKHEWKYVREDIVMCAKCNAFSTDELQKERDELRAQVAVLREALSKYGDLVDYTRQAVDYMARGLDASRFFDEKRKISKQMKDALVSTASQSTMRVNKLVEALEYSLELLNVYEKAQHLHKCGETTGNWESIVYGIEIAQKALAEWRRDKCSS